MSRGDWFREAGFGMFILGGSTPRTVVANGPSGGKISIRATTPVLPMIFSPGA